MTLISIVKDGVPTWPMESIGSPGIPIEDPSAESTLSWPEEDIDEMELESTRGLFSGQE